MTLYESVDKTVRVLTDADRLHYILEHDKTCVHNFCNLRSECVEVYARCIERLVLSRVGR